MKHTSWEVEWNVEFEEKVMKYILGLLAQYGKPLSEFSELQRTLLEEDVYKLARGIIYEGEKTILSSQKKQIIEEMIELSDKIELEGNTTLEEWKAFKAFRNTMRDRLK